MSENFSVAVIGCGHWGKNHVRTFNELGALAAVADADTSTLAEIGAMYQVPTKSVADIMSDSSIDGVVIAAPAELHANLALTAFAAGKHVFVEKPIATNLADARAMADAAEKSGKSLMVGHLLHYHPVFEKLKAMTHDGALGNLRYVYSHRLNMGKLRTEENALWSLAPHDISMVLGLSGEKPAEVVHCDATYVTDDVADIAHMHFKFPSGVQGHIFSSWLNPFKEQRLTVIGDKAMAVFDDCAPWDEKLALYRHRIEVKNGTPVAVKERPEYIVVAKDEPLKRECQHFIDVASTGARPNTDAIEALNVLEVLQQASSTNHPRQ